MAEISVLRVTQLLLNAILLNFSSCVQVFFVSLVICAPIYLFNILTGCSLLWLFGDLFTICVYTLLAVFAISYYHTNNILAVYNMYTVQSMQMIFWCIFQNSRCVSSCILVYCFALFCVQVVHLKFSFFKKKKSQWLKQIWTNPTIGFNF